MEQNDRTLALAGAQLDVQQELERALFELKRVIVGQERMLERVKRTSKQCLIFKVYGATRHCGTPEQMKAAMELACRHAKAGDAFVIGMFPKYKEQVRENCRLLLEALKMPGPRDRSYRNSSALSSRASTARSRVTSRTAPVRVNAARSA